MQKLQIIGNIGREPELKTGNGTSFYTFTVACNQTLKKADGTKEVLTNWYSVILDEKRKALVQSLKKGTKVLVYGNFSVKVYRNQAGANLAGLNVRADILELLSAKKEETNGGDQGTPSAVSGDKFRPSDENGTGHDFDNFVPPVADNDVPPSNDDLPF